MVWSACVLLLLLVTTARADEELAESVMEKPAVSRRSTEGTAEVAVSRGVHTSGGSTVSRSVEVEARQGKHVARQDMVTATFNAFNPLPYIRGGLDGVRQVMQQRFHPFQGMFYRQVPPRYNNNKFRGGPTLAPLKNGGVRHVGGGVRPGPGGPRGVRHNGSGGGGGGFGHGSGGGGGSGFRHGSGDGGGSNVGQRGVRGTNNAIISNVKDVTNNPLFPTNSGFRSPNTPTNNPFSSVSGPIESIHFGTPKPNSVMGGARPVTHHFDNDPISFTPHPAGDLGETSLGAPRPPDAEDKFTRVINIQIPEEMQNLTILEISMKANGDVSISGGPEHEGPHHPSVPVLPDGFGLLDLSDVRDVRDVSSPQSFPAGVEDMLAEDQRLHGLNLDAHLHDPDYHTNQKGLPISESGLHDFFPVRPYGITSLQDILRMKTVGKTNKALDSGILLPWHTMDNLSSHRLRNSRYDFRTAQLLQSLLRNNRVPSLSPKQLELYKQSLKNNVYLVPFVSSPPKSQSRPQTMPRAPVQKQRSQPDDEATPIYYIDITLPGNPGGTPSVSTSQLRRHRRSLEFDGWFPMDVSNPMADDPTLGYQPPPLERVRFSNEPVSEKPLYPVIPENPTVFVVRAEPQQPKYHSVYGTENVEYFHIHPQTNTVRAFRAPSQSVDALQFVAAPQLADASTSQPVEENIDAPPVRPDINSNLANIPAKEKGFSDKSDVIVEEITDSTRSIPDEAMHTQKNCESDMEGAFSEIRSSVVKGPVHGRPLRQRNKVSNQGTDAHSIRYRPDLPIRRYDQDHRELDFTLSKPGPILTRPALHELLGNLPQESQIEESPYLGSATDSARASFFREIPPPDFRLSSRRPSGQRTSPSGGQTRTRGDADRTASQSALRPWFLIDTRSPDKRREPSIASYIFPETHTGDEKIHYKPFGPVTYVSKGDKASLEHLQNPHLDDHMNSYKPTLTANSLSELLQIFRFTQVTEESDPATEEPVTIREFRYTRPTEDPPITGSSDDIFPSSFRYTPSPSNFSDPTTEAPVTNKPAEGDTSFIDAVADTNSLDGYLFSDSEASPEYAHPQVRPNVVSIDRKEESSPKSVTKGSLVAKHGTNVNSKNVRGGLVTPGRLEGLEIIYPGQPQAKKDTTTSPLYVIHQGHSKVQVYGINSAEEKRLSELGFSDLFFFSNSERPITSFPSITSAPRTPSSPPRGTTFPSTTSTSTLTTTSSPSPSTVTTVSTSDTKSPITSAPSTLPHTSTPPVTKATTVAPPTNITVQDIPPTSTEIGEYDYYYDGKLGFPDLAFGEDYLGEEQDLPLLRIPSPFLPHSNLPYLALPPSAPGTPTTVPATDEVHNRLPQAERPLHDTEAVLALSPAVALTRAELSVARPVFFTKRRADITDTADDTQLSQPFEYLSQLRNIESERPFTVREATPKPVSQPRMKRVTASVEGA